MFTTGYVKIGVVSNNDYEGSDTAAEEVFDFLNLNFGSATNMQLRFDQASAGYGQNVIGIASTSLSKVIGVTKSSISEVIGVS